MIGLEALFGDFPHIVVIMVSPVPRGDRGIGGQGEVDARVRHQVCLELRQVHIQGPVETKGCGDAVRLQSSVLIN